MRSHLFMDYDVFHHLVLLNEDAFLPLKWQDSGGDITRHIPLHSVLVAFMWNSRLSITLHKFRPNICYNFCTFTTNDYLFIIKCMPVYPIIILYEKWKMGLCWSNQQSNSNQGMSEFTNHCKIDYLTGMLLQILTWGLRNMKTYQLAAVSSPSLVVECGDKYLESAVIKSLKRCPNFPRSVLFMKVVRTCISWMPCSWCFKNAELISFDHLFNEWRVVSQLVQRVGQNLLDI